ncbi:hypothetical protein CVT24_003211 [Panaeolus cyanescens]|uniref:CS domain-containing protein n=1 Tax=Panaeolus cyanescens TaxID=181874 RepID=A0A409VUE4_9AGAR|nr:hypothetical protein CVT24_003211 [Panaeolus cyanescens]
MPQHPDVLWAQRSSETIDYMYKITSTSIHFKAKAGTEGNEYAFDLDFFSEIDVENSTSKLNDRSFSATLRKKEKKVEYWPRLTKEKVRNAWIRIDYERWKDEDEQDEHTYVDDDDSTGGLASKDGFKSPQGDTGDLSHLENDDGSVPGVGGEDDNDSDDNQ